MKIAEDPRAPDPELTSPAEPESGVRLPLLGLCRAAQNTFCGAQNRHGSTALPKTQKSARFPASRQLYLLPKQQPTRTLTILGSAVGWPIIMRGGGSGTVLGEAGHPDYDREFELIDNLESRFIIN